MTNPSLVLVHGAWHSPAHFGPLISYLEGCDYKCVAVALPSSIQNTGDDVPKTLDPDIVAVRTTVLKELDGGFNVVVVAHSYGGMPVMSALNGLDKKARTDAGHSTCVEAVACIAAFLLPVGVSLLDACGGSPAPIHDIQGDLVHVSKPGPEHWFYDDLSAEDTKKWVALLRPQAWNPKDKVTYAAYEVIPTSYLVCTKDNALPPAAQRGMVEAANKGPLRVRAEEIDASHSPYLSMVERTGEFIRRSAGEDIPIKT